MCATTDKLTRRAYPKGYADSLEDRIRNLESQLRDLKKLLQEKNEEIDNLSKLRPHDSHSYELPDRRSDMECTVTINRFDSFIRLFDSSLNASHQNCVNLNSADGCHSIGGGVDVYETGENSLGSPAASGESLYFNSTASSLELQFAGDDYDALLEPVSMTLSTLFGGECVESGPPITQTLSARLAASQPGSVTASSSQYCSISNAANSSSNANHIAVSPLHYRGATQKTSEKPAACRRRAEMDLLTRKSEQPLSPFQAAGIDCQSAELDALINRLADGSTNIFDVCNTGLPQNGTRHTLDRGMMQYTATALHDAVLRPPVAQLDTDCGSHCHSEAVEYSPSSPARVMPANGNMHLHCNDWGNSEEELEGYGHIGHKSRAGAEGLISAIGNVSPSCSALEHGSSVDIAMWLSNEA